MLIFNWEGTNKNRPHDVSSRACRVLSSHREIAAVWDVMPCDLVDWHIDKLLGCKAVCFGRLVHVDGGLLGCKAVRFVKLVHVDALCSPETSSDTHFCYRLSIP
jgi:hypothetical protein